MWLLKKLRHLWMRLHRITQAPCIYCGTASHPYWYAAAGGVVRWYYRCPKCLACGPDANTKNAALQKFIRAD